MSARVARRTQGFTESVIRRMTRVAQAHGAINLAQGFPDYDPPREVVEAAKAALDGGFNQYAVTWGSPRLREALASKLGSWSGAPVDPERELVITCGSTEAMLASLLALINPGERVAIFSPYYENYGADSELCGAEPIFLPLEAPDFAVDLDAVRKAFAEGARALIVCNPSNPSGKVFARAELEALLALATEYDAWLIMDEVYEHIVYAPHVHCYAAGLPGAAERVITCGSLSKTYAITGWRLGYVRAPAAVCGAIKQVHDFLTVGAAAPLQEAAVAALLLPESYYTELSAAYAARRDCLLGYLAQAGLRFVEPQGAYYVLVDVSELGRGDDVAVAEWMSKEVGVTPVPGSSFFASAESRYVRLHFAKRLETLRAAGERLRRIPELAGL